MNLQETLSAIPYLPPHQISVEAGDGSVVARMAFRRELTNYVGTIHAGALFTLAETAAGVAATAVIPEDKAFVLLREASFAYTRRAESDLVARATVAPEAAAQARRDFERGGKADSPVIVTITDAQGAPVFEGRFDYALRQVKT
jgi:uncharacterized protein (TIGR00369 family)